MLDLHQISFCSLNCFLNSFQQIEVEVELTTNHWGWFELKLCPVNDKKVIETQKCMDKHPLYLVKNPRETKFYIPPDSKKKDIFRYKVQLPPDVVCSQCVVQWTYRAGKHMYLLTLVYIYILQCSGERVLIHGATKNFTQFK